MKLDEKKTRARNFRDALTDYGEQSGLKFVLYILTDEDPLPAPQIMDYTTMNDTAMVIIRDANRPEHTTFADMVKNAKEAPDATHR